LLASLAYLEEFVFHFSGQSPKNETRSPFFVSEAGKISILNCVGFQNWCGKKSPLGYPRELFFRAK
jgi:hypothetical protein